MSSPAQTPDPRQHFRKEDDARALNMVLRMGTIYEVDFESVPPLARIESGELITDLVPFPNEIGNNFRRWRPLRLGSQVLFACPSGDSRQAVIVCTYNTVDFPQPDFDPAVDLILFDDGTEIRKTPDLLSVHSTVDIEVTAPNITAEADETITLRAPLITLDGDVVVTGGNLTKEGGSVSHDGIDIGATHYHLIIAPTPGTPVTEPQPL